MKRTLIIGIAVVVLLGVGIGIYLLFFHNAGGLTAGTPGTFPSSETGTTPDSVAGTQELGVPVQAGNEVAPKLVRVSERPVANGLAAFFVPASLPDASSTEPAHEADVHVSYVERESGNMYTYGVHARTLTRLSNKTLPGVQDATWLSDGSLAFVRFLEGSGTTEQVNTYALPANGEGGYFLSPGLSQVLVRDTSTLATVLSTTDGSSASVSTPTGGGLRNLFSTPIASLRLGLSGNSYIVTTKGSAQASGYAFAVGSDGSFTRILGPLSGLATLASPNGAYLLYSYLDRGKLALAVLDLKTHIATRLPLATLPEKCVWSADGASIYCGVPTSLTGTQPDDWYQGASSFTDRIWRIDMANRVATLIVDPKTSANIDIDAVALTLDPASDILAFVNRRDHLLYVYDL